MLRPSAPREPLTRRAPRSGTATVLAALGLAAALLSALAPACAADESFAACASDADCDDVAPRCHPTAAVCVADCTTDATACPDGETCDGATGLCACQPGASGAGACPDGLTCHVEDLICVVPGCDAGCGDGRTCCGNPNQCLWNASRCESSLCDDDTTCGSFERCDRTAAPSRCMPLDHEDPPQEP